MMTSRSGRKIVTIKIEAEISPVVENNGAKWLLWRVSVIITAIVNICINLKL
jgi:hypothetical protein